MTDNRSELILVLILISGQVLTEFNWGNHFILALLEYLSDFKFYH